MIEINNAKILYVHGKYIVTNLKEVAPRKKVSHFLANQKTKVLIESIKSCGTNEGDIIQKVSGNYSDGRRQGTYMCLELFLEFLKWIDLDVYKGFRQHLGMPDIVVGSIRPEFTFGEDIVMNLFSAYEVVEQYPVFGGKYRIDWYIPELKIAVEFDEPHHTRNIGNDAIRQQQIEEELGCRFIRYTA